MYICTFTEIPVSKSSSTENYEIIRHKPTFMLLLRYSWFYRTTDPFRITSALLFWRANRHGFGVLWRNSNCFFYVIEKSTDFNFANSTVCNTWEQYCTAATVKRSISSYMTSDVPCKRQTSRWRYQMLYRDHLTNPPPAKQCCHICVTL